MLGFIKNRGMTKALIVINISSVLVNALVYTNWVNGVGMALGIIASSVLIVALKYGD